jgi:ribosomal protein S27AE
MSRTRRGRPRKFQWIESKDISENHSPEAQFLKFVSVNNPFMARVASSGCPRCRSRNFRLRHDEKFGNIRFYCQGCGYETSFHIKKPTRDQLSVIPVYDDQGLLIDEKVVDVFHEQTERETVDVKVSRAEQRLDLGGEWFDGVSGAESQNRCLTREEAIERIRKRQMRAQIATMLKEIEREERDDRLAAAEADMSSDED